MALSSDDRAEILGIVRSQLLSSPQAFLTSQFMPYLGAGRGSAGLTPCCILQHTTDVTAANNTQYTLGTTAPFGSAFETVAHDSGGMRNAASPGRIYINDPGVYDANWGIEWQANVAGERFAGLKRSGTLIAPEGDTSSPNIGASFGAVTRGSTLVKVTQPELAAAGSGGIYLEVLALQITGGNLTASQAFFSAVLVANL